MLTRGLTVDAQVLDGEKQKWIQTESHLRGAIRQEMGGEGDRGLVHAVVQHARVPADQRVASMAGEQYRGVGNRSKRDQGNI